MSDRVVHCNNLIEGFQVIGMPEIGELMAEYQELVAKRDPGTCTGAAKPVWADEGERPPPNASGFHPYPSVAWSWSQFGFGSFSA